MYTYFVTTASSSSIIKSIKCRLLKDSSTEFLVCLKSNSIDLYSLPNYSEGSSHAFDNDSNPFLVSSLHSYFTFVTCIEYRPPDHNQSYLLVLTQNYTLLLLKFDAENLKFISKNVACLQEQFSGVRYGNIILKIDEGYNLIVFCGHSRTLKCIVLNKSNYFVFSDIITMRTNDSFFLDVEFMSVEYKSQASLKSNFSTESRSYSSSLNQDLQFRSPNRNSSVQYLECKLIVLGQDSETDRQSDPVRWLYGMHISFEIELLNGLKRFNSYSNVPLFGDPVKLSSPFSMFVPLSLNDTKKFDSLMILGAGSVAYTSFKNPKDVKNFRLDYSITEVCCYLKYSFNKYVFADDNGNVYLMELMLSHKSEGTALKRRVGSSSGPKSVYTTKVEDDMVVRDVRVQRVGSCAIPSSIVKLDDRRVFCASKIGNSSTIEISSDMDGLGRPERRRCWVHSNIGPVRDFIYLQETDDSNGCMLASCGMGSSGALCKIYFGIGSEVLYSKEVGGVSNLFSLYLRCEEPSEVHLVLCISFYRFTRFYTVNQINPEGRDKSESLNLVETKLSEIVRLERDELVYDETTLLCSKLGSEYVIQVTPLNVVLLKNDLKMVTRVSVSELVVSESGSEVTVSSIVCGSRVLLLLSSNVLFLLDRNLKVVERKKLAMSISSIAYISQGDLASSNLRASSALKNYKCDGVLAASGWDNLIMVLSLSSLEIMHTYRCNINFGTFIKSLKFGMVESEVYLLASVSDGKLYTYKLVDKSRSAESDSAIKIELDNIVELSDGSFKLLDVKMSFDDDSCNLGTNKLITTGNKCSIVQAKQNKIEYATVNVNNLWALTTLPNKRHTAILGSSKTDANRTFSSGSGQEVLVVYYTNKSLVIGTLDFAKNLNVKRIVSGTNLNKVVYHSSAKLAVVSTIPQYVVDPNRLHGVVDRNHITHSQEHGESVIKRRKLNSDLDVCGEGSEGVLGSEHTQLVKPYFLEEDKRFFSDHSHRRQNLMLCTDTDEILEGTNDAFFPSCLLFVDLENNDIVHKLEVPKGHIISSLRSYSHQNVEYIAVGTSLMSEKHEFPVEGHLFLLEISKRDDAFHFRVQRTFDPFEGGVVDIAILNELLVLSVNCTLMIMALHVESPCTLSLSDKTNAKSAVSGEEGTGSVGAKSSKCERKTFRFEYVHGCSEDCKNHLELITSYESNTYIVSVDVCDDSIFVGDLMTSVKLLKFKDGCLYECCRDFNMLWTSSLAAVDPFTCLVSDDSGNFIVFAKAKNPVNDHKSIKFDTLGLFHHGETVNRILKRQKANRSSKQHFKISSKLGQKLHSCNRLFCCHDVGSSHEEFRVRRLDNLFDTIFTCCTSSGSFLQLCLFRDLKLFLKLSLLENTLQLFHSDMGINFNKNYRNFENIHATMPSKGFVDGDLIERFLRLPQQLKQKVFDSFRKNSSEMELECHSLDQLVADIETIHNSRLA